MTQEVPLHNSTDRPLVFTATFSGSAAQNFLVTREVTVGPRSHSSFQLTFAPRWIGRVAGELVMRSSTGETSSFALSGKSTEPLAEGNIVIETCARQPATQAIRVPNALGERDVVYDVSTDVGALSGAPALSVRANGTGAYDLTASPLFTGAQKGTLTFTAQQGSGEYVFYTVEIVARPPAESGTVDLAAEPGRAVILQLPIGNPLDTTVEFTVHAEGSHLFAPRKVSVPSKERRVLEVAYCPATAPQETRGQLRLSSPQLGEFRFGLSLSCTNDVPENANDLRLHGGSGEESSAPRTEEEQAAGDAAAWEEERRNGAHAGTSDAAGGAGGGRSATTRISATSGGADGGAVQFGELRVAQTTGDDFLI